MIQAVSEVPAGVFFDGYENVVAQATYVFARVVVVRSLTLPSYVLEDVRSAIIGPSSRLGQTG